MRRQVWLMGVGGKQLVYNVSRVEGHAAMRSNSRSSSRRSMRGASSL